MSSRTEPSQSALRAVHTALTTGRIDDEGAGEARRLGLLEVHHGLYGASALGAGDRARPTHDGLVALAMRWCGDD